VGYSNVPIFTQFCGGCDVISAECENCLFALRPIVSFYLIFDDTIFFFIGNFLMSQQLCYEEHQALHSFLSYPRGAYLFSVTRYDMSLFFIAVVATANIYGKVNITWVPDEIKIQFCFVFFLSSDAR
jgi:hypothetical protein